MALVTALSGCGGVSGLGGSGAGNSSGAGRSSDSSALADEELPDSHEIYAQMKASATTATSLRIAGYISEPGASATFDVSGSRDGTNQNLLITLDSQTTVTVLTVDGKDYIKADRNFLMTQGLGQVPELAGDKYITTPSLDNSMSSQMNIGRLLDMFFTIDYTDDDEMTVEKTELDGVPVYRMVQVIEDGGQVEVWASADGETRMLRAISTVEQMPMNVTFSEWNAVPEFAAPTADQVVSF